MKRMLDMELTSSASVVVEDIALDHDCSLITGLRHETALVGSSTNIAECLQELSERGLRYEQTPTIDAALDVRLLLEDLDHEQRAIRGTDVRCTLREFLTTNADDEDSCRKADALKPGEHVELGGGAGVLTRVTRVL